MIALRDLTLAAMTTRAVNTACRSVGLGRVGSAVVTAATSKAMQVAATSLPFPNPAARILFLLRVAALAVCPDPDDHPSLEVNCANPVDGEVTTEAFEVWLHDKQAPNPRP